MTSSQFLGLQPDTWSALGAIGEIGTLLVAGAATVIAVRQLRQGNAVRLDQIAVRLDQTRPYVLVTLESSPIDMSIIDVRIQNVGIGPAHRVRIRVDPPLERANELDDMPLAKSPLYTEELSMLPPGYDLRTFFDDMEARHRRPELPTKYTFTVSYDDGHGNAWTESTIQDLAVLNDQLFTQLYGIHHVAKSLREIEKAVTKSPLAKGQVDATIETRDEKRDRQRSEHEALRQRMADFRTRNQASADAQAEAPDDAGGEVETTNEPQLDAGGS